MGKFYDVQKSNDYFTMLETAFGNYQSEAEKLNTAFAVFAGDEDEKGQQAEAAQELVGIGEKNLVDKLVDIQGQIRDAATHIKTAFESEVDAAENALIEIDTLETIQEEFSAFYKTFDDLGTQIEDIALILQSKYGQYATFEKPDFDAGRDAFTDFCGGNGSGGFLRECEDKLDAFDLSETTYLDGLGLSDMLSELQTIVDNASTIFASLDMSDPEIAAQCLCDVKIDPVTGDILIKGKNGDWEPVTEDQEQFLKEKLGEEGFCEMRKNLLYAKYENGQQNLIDVLRATNVWSGSLTVDYQTYVDLGIIDESTYELIKDFIVVDEETGRYSFETAMEDHTSGREKLTDEQLKAIGFIYAANMTEYELLNSVEQADARGDVVEKLLENVYGFEFIDTYVYNAKLNDDIVIGMESASNHIQELLPGCNENTPNIKHNYMAAEYLVSLKENGERPVSIVNSKKELNVEVTLLRGDGFYDKAVVTFNKEALPQAVQFIFSGIEKSVQYVKSQPEKTYAYVNSLGMDSYAIAGALMNANKEEDAAFLDCLFKIPDGKEETYSEFFLSHDPYLLSDETGVTLSLFSMKLLDKEDTAFYDFTNGMLACKREDIEWKKGTKREQYLKLLSNGSCAYATVINNAAIDYLKKMGLIYMTNLRIAWFTKLICNGYFGHHCMENT